MFGDIGIRTFDRVRIVILCEKLPSTKSSKLKTLSLSQTRYEIRL